MNSDLSQMRIEDALAILDERLGHLPVRRMRSRRWACPKCKWGVSDKGQLCEFCEGEQDDK